MKWVLNTIAYGDLMKDDNFSQLDMIDSIQKLGFKYVELRSEYFNDTNQELAALKQASEQAELTVFLSVPAPLFDQGHLHSELESFFAMAKAVGAVQLKLNLGAFNPETVAGDMKLVNALIDQYQIHLVLENDNTLATGSSDYFKNFLKDFKHDQLGMCFDVGNFLFFDENPVAAVKNVLPFVDYVHLKQVEQATRTTLTGLSVGSVDIPAVLTEVSKEIPVAVECQYMASDIEEVEEQIKTDLENISASLA